VANFCKMRELGCFAREMSLFDKATGMRELSYIIAKQSRQRERLGESSADPSPLISGQEGKSVSWGL